jgi:hypothetical protein
MFLISEKQGSGFEGRGLFRAWLIPHCRGDASIAVFRM